VRYDERGGYIMDFDSRFHWFEHYLTSLLSSPMYNGEMKLYPASMEHLRATMEFLEALKGTPMDWDRFIHAVGGDIREIEWVEVSDG